MSCVTYAYPIIALFQPSQAKEQRVVGEKMITSPSQLSVCSSFCVYTFPDRCCAESITYAYPIIALFQHSQAKEQRVVGEKMIISPSQLSV